METEQSRTAHSLTLQICGCYHFLRSTPHPRRYECGCTAVSSLPQAGGPQVAARQEHAVPRVRQGLSRRARKRLRALLRPPGDQLRLRLDRQDGQQEEHRGRAVHDVALPRLPAGGPGGGHRPRNGVHAAGPREEPWPGARPRQSVRQERWRKPDLLLQGQAGHRHGDQGAGVRVQHPRLPFHRQPDGCGGPPTAPRPA